MNTLLIFTVVVLVWILIKGDSIYWYVIKKGNHYATLNINRLRVFNFKNSVKYKVMFDESVLYDTKGDGGDINKLCGFTDVNSTVHRDSIRFGWRANNNRQQVDIFAYWYVDGIRNSLFLDSLELHEIHELKLSIEKDTYRFQVDNQIFVTYRKKRGSIGLRTRLFPYFGGDLKAPHNIRIYLKQV